MNGHLRVPYHEVYPVKTWKIMARKIEETPSTVAGYAMDAIY
jgi:hypothetical protein